MNDGGNSRLASTVVGLLLILVGFGAGILFERSGLDDGYREGFEHGERQVLRDLEMIGVVEDSGKGVIYNFTNPKYQLQYYRVEGPVD